MLFHTEESLIFIKKTYKNLDVAGFEPALSWKPFKKIYKYYINIIQCVAERLWWRGHKCGVRLERDSCESHFSSGG